mgnify:CR=1 FL=1
MTRAVGSNETLISKGLRLEAPAIVASHISSNETLISKGLRLYKRFHRVFRTGVRMKP